MSDLQLGIIWDGFLTLAAIGVLALIVFAGYAFIHRKFFNEW